MKNIAKYMNVFLNEMWNTKVDDLDELHSIFSPNLIALSPLGMKTGVDNLKQTNITWSQGFPDMALSNIDIMNAGNIVVAQWKSTGTNINSFNGSTPTGRKIEYDGVTIFQFDGQEVVRYKCIINMLDIYAQLGFFLEQESYTNQGLIRRNHELLLNEIKNHFILRSLSDREIECLSFSIHGWSAKQIALHLNCSYRTVQHHIASTMNKIDCHSKYQIFDLLKSLKVLPLFEDLYKVCFNKYTQPTRLK